MTAQQKIRIVTWNCCKGDRVKTDEILKKYNPDVAIFQEMIRPKTEDDDTCVWVHNSLTKKLGMGVVSAHGWKLDLCNDYPDTYEVFAPVKVSNATHAINLLGVWTQKEGKYVESFKQVLIDYQKFLHPLPSIIAGDFNSNPFWNSKHKKFNHTELNNTLENNFKLVSAYHAKHSSVLPGNEGVEHATFFMYGHQDKPYHIDYCYVPKDWTIDCARIGSYDDWCNKEKINKTKKSDHCPLIVDLIINDTGQKSNMKWNGQNRFCADIKITSKLPNISSK